MTVFEPEIFHTKVVGVSFEGRQQVLQTLERIEKVDKDSVEISLRPEPTNQYDPNAIAVDVTYFDSAFLSKVTRQLGYVRSELAVQLTDDIQKGYGFDVVDFETTGGYNHTKGVNITILRKEASMAKITAMDLLNRTGGQSYKDIYLELRTTPVLNLRFLKPLSEAHVQATHSLLVEQPRKYERFACLKYIEGDDTVDCPADELDNKPWVKLVLPVIDRSDGKVKLFRETAAVFKKLKLFEGQPANDAEKAVKIGDITNADIQIIQIGSGKDRQINAFPVQGTLRPLSTQERAMPHPDLNSGVKILTRQEIRRITDIATHLQNASVQGNMNLSMPQSGGPLA